MANQEVAFDPELFARTASIFTMKRKAFAPKAVETLATDVLSRLAGGIRQADPFDVPPISAESISAFCDALILPDSNASKQFIEERRAEGVTRMGVTLGYVCAAAKRLGEGWEADQLSFIDVTIGTGHLYAIMRALRAERRLKPMQFDARRCALFATVPGEDHGIGITVAADYFREKGWEIDLQTATKLEALLAHVEHTQPGIIGLSLSTEERLDTLVRLVVGMRLIVPDAIIGVAPAADLGDTRIRELLDIDLVFTSAQGAEDDLESLISANAHARHA